MRIVDRLLQKWRARVARSWIPQGAVVLDVGCHQGEFLLSLGRRIGPSVGLDPLASPANCPGHRLLPGRFAEPLPLPAGSFDAIVLLATLEHIRERRALGRECLRLLRPGGCVIITVPSPRVDQILTALCGLRLADGMSLEEHDGFDPRTTPQFFEPCGFVLERRRRFQLGLNHLFVFRKPMAVAACDMSCPALSALTESPTHA